jgi:hypothetical protein
VWEKRGGEGTEKWYKRENIKSRVEDEGWI